MALTAQQSNIAHLLYRVAVNHGLSPARAREFVEAAYEESGLNPRINNRAGSGAAGLFQLLSSGYVNRAKQLGGVYNPRANALAILPDYARYWQTHPNAAPGQAARDVERSGQGAGFYSRHLSMFNDLGGAATPPQVGGPSTSSGLSAAPDRTALVHALIQQVGQKPDVASLLPLIQGQPKANVGSPPAPQVPQAATGGPLAADPQAQRVIALAKQYEGTPYKWGGSSPKTGFDCSGFVQWLYGHVGINLPRTTYQQWKVGRPVAKDQLRPGDVLFFEPGRNGPGHEGLYIGNGQFIESPHTGASVRVSTLAGRRDYMGARRVH